MVGMAQELALNIDPTPWNISKADRDRRIRIWWAVYIQERWSAFALGRSPNINEDYCTTPMIKLENFSNGDFGTTNNTTLTSARIFVGIAELTKILSELIKNFYTIKGIGRLQALTIQEFYAMAGSYEERLHAFQREHLEPLRDVDTLLDSTGLSPYHRVANVDQHCFQARYSLHSTLLKLFFVVVSSAISREKTRAI